MKLFIANTTKQNHVFAYTLPEKAHAVTTDIPIGQQRQIGGDLSPAQIDHIVKSHERYGLRAYKELKHTRRGFVGLCYSVDKPVPMEGFYEQYEANDAALTERSKELREETAIAIQASIEHQLQTPVQRTELEIIEETPAGGTPSVAEGIEVTAEGAPSRHASRRSRRGGL